MIPYRLLAEILVVLGIVLGGWWWHVSKVDDAHTSGLTAGRAEIRAKWDAAELVRQQTALKAQADEDQKQAQIRAALQESDRANIETIKRLSLANAAAGAAADRVRNQLAAYVAAARADRDRADPAATASSGLPAGDPVGVLADMLGSLVEVSRRYAAAADGAFAGWADVVGRYDAAAGASAGHAVSVSPEGLAGAP